MQIDWKSRLLSQRTLGRLIWLELLLALIFLVATVVLAAIPPAEISRGRIIVATAVTPSSVENRFRYPFLKYRNTASGRASLFEFSQVNRVFVDLLSIEDESVSTETTTGSPPDEKPDVPPYKEPDMPPLLDLEGLVLVGTLTGADGESIAIVRDDNIGHTIYVRNGDELNGFIIQSILDNAIQVAFGEEVEELLGASYMINSNGD